VAAASTPKHFAMPSLMADLGVIEPRFNVLIAAVVIGMALVAIALGIAPTAWRLHRRAARSTAIARQSAVAPACNESGRAAASGK